MDHKTYFMIDVETDGPIPGDYSMVETGAVVFEPEGPLDKAFSGYLRPISDKYEQKRLDIIGATREQTLNYEDPLKVMREFETFVMDNTKGRPVFISDNNGFDWMFKCWYMHHFLGRNPFGHSSKNLSNLFQGMQKNTHASMKGLRKTIHDHKAVNDARGNAEVLQELVRRGLIL